MTKTVYILVFYLFVFLVVAFSGEQAVQIRFLPGREPWTTTLGVALLLFTTIGVAAALILGLFDRAQLQRTNRRVQKEVESLRKEVASLRDLATLERDAP